MNKIDEYIEAELNQLEAEEEYIPDCLGELAEKVAEKFDTSCIYEHVGGFDSTGYDLDCYAFAYIDEDGKLGIFPYEHESY